VGRAVGHDPAVGIVEQLAQRADDRRRWLEHATRVLAGDSTVAAAWLWGSEGRGDADELSDFDLFVIVHDAAEIASVHERFFAFGEVQWCREVPFNAPTGGRYFTVGYPAAVEPLPVDFYWQPASDAVLGTDARVLVEKAPIRRVDVETFATFTPMADRPSPHPDDPRQRLEGLLVWFWSMFGSLSKQLARGQDEQAAEQVPLLDGVLALALAELGRPHSPLAGVPVLVSLRHLAAQMEALHDDLASIGLEVPGPAATKKAWTSLDVADELRAAGWRSR
jgi:hypothetical protein